MVTHGSTKTKKSTIRYLIFDNETRVIAVLASAEGCTTMILQEQLVEHFGDEYSDIRRRTLAFNKTILNRPPLSQVKYQIFNNEGGGGNLLRKALCYIIEKGDVDSGLDAYASYLNEEYSTTNNRSTVHHTKWLMGEEGPYSPFGVSVVDRGVDRSDDPSSTSQDVTLSARRLKEVIHSDEEWQFWMAYANMNGSIVGAAEALGIPIEDARRIYFRVYRRANS